MRHIVHRSPAHLSGLACACDPQSLDGLDGFGSFLKKAVKDVGKLGKKIVDVHVDVAKLALQNPQAAIAGAAGIATGNPAMIAGAAQQLAAGLVSPGTAAPPDAVLQQQAAQQQQAAAGRFDLNQFIADNKLPLGIGAGLLTLALVMPSGGRR